MVFFFLSTLLAVVVYRFVPVAFTPLMGIRLYEHFRADKPLRLAHTWVPLSQISHHLPQALVASEDNLFIDHHGFDLEQIQQARNEAEKGRVWASNISQQDGKMFSLPGKSYVLG